MKNVRGNHRKWIIILCVLFLWLLAAVLAVVAGHYRNPLTEIADKINRRGRCVIPGVGEVRAQSARLEDGVLVLYGSDDPNEESGVAVALYPDMGPEGICRAESVSIQRMFDPEERLKITFRQPTHLPRIMSGRGFMVPVFRHVWFSRIRFFIRDFVWSRRTRKPRSASP